MLWSLSIFAISYTLRSYVTCPIKPIRSNRVKPLRPAEVRCRRQISGYCDHINTEDSMESIDTNVPPALINEQVEINPKDLQETINDIPHNKEESLIKAVLETIYMKLDAFQVAATMHIDSIVVPLTQLIDIVINVLDQLHIINKLQVDRIHRIESFIVCILYRISGRDLSKYLMAYIKDKMNQ